jgi:L-lactate dehydrogenase (cytochrome)
MLFDMVDGAAGDEITMRRNEAALTAIELAPKLLAGAPKRDQSVELFGLPGCTSPVIIGPTGLAGPVVAACRARGGPRGGALRN